MTILIDNGVEIMGYPEMTVSGGRNSMIRAMYAENMIIETKAPKGNRNEIDGKKMVDIKDIFMPDGGSERLFKPTYIRVSSHHIILFIDMDRPGTTGGEPWPGQGIIETENLLMFIKVTTRFILYTMPIHSGTPQIFSDSSAKQMWQDLFRKKRMKYALP